MKDPLGHGSNSRGANDNARGALHSGTPKSAPAPVHSSMRTAGMSDKSWHDTMPIANYTGQIQDMLAMWDGTHKHSPLSASESQQINDAYAARGSWRDVAGHINDRRRLRAVK